MDRLTLLGLRTFHTIAEQGTLRAAAGILGVNASAVSQQLKAFEEHLGTSLFVRSTRSVVLTDAGRTLLERTRHLLNEADAALEAVRSEAKDLSGPLRITLPFRAWQLVIAPRLEQFHLAFPDITLDLAINEELTDIQKDGFHAGIRLGDYLSGDVIAKALSKPLQGAYVASPDYLSRYSMPQSPSDLLAHRCIRHRQLSSGQITPWEFVIDDHMHVVAASGSLIVSDLRSVVDAALRGLGVGWSLKAGVADHLRDGSLRQVLADVTPERPGFHVYFPRQLQTLPRLRAFIDHFSAQ
ncbi:LysR substrate-binding domain-containing protein [Roseobacter litoralis]|uniref:LysR substrate-binding domain-containing protein n=1 Tax=Roseobacter litoralis TaxID=42443 RepID=UPI002493C0DA|nr:LysR substrate-binding domain-containing protein [Roseobacter litoralis]